MKRSWLVLLIVIVFAGMAGVAIAGRPASVDRLTIPASTASESTTPSTPSTPTSVVVAVSTTLLSDVDRAALNVIVANGTDLTGIAGETAIALVNAGYTKSVAVDALSLTASTVVYYRPGFNEAAVSVAAELELSDSRVQALPADAVTGQDQLGDVIVVIGADFPG